MEKGDIGVTVHSHVACWFEDLIVTVHGTPQEEKKNIWQRFLRKEEEPLSGEEWKNHMVSRWTVNEMPLRSIIHLQNQLGIKVEVYTYFEDALREVIEAYLARKGAHVQVYCYGNLDNLKEDMKYNRDVHTLFTPYENDAAAIGWHRATVVRPDGTFGF